MSHNNPSGEKGTRWEVAVVNFLTGYGFPNFERRRLRGRLDAADFLGIPGWLIGAKDTKGLNLGPAMNALRRAAGRLPIKPDFVASIHKRRSHRVERAYVVMELVEWARLVRMAGYGDPLGPHEDGRRVTVEPGFTESPKEHARALESR